jgi:hypothetical protein
MQRVTANQNRTKMETFLTKQEIARMICNQYRGSEETLERMAKKLAELSDEDLKREANRAGFTYENFDYGRYYIR